MSKKNWTQYFKEHELKIINVFCDALPDDVCKKFYQQLSAIGVVQRMGNGLDVNLYSKKLFKPCQLDCEAFPSMPEELHVATLHPVGMDDASLLVKIWFVEGRPFTLEFQGTEPVNTAVDWQCELLIDFDDYAVDSPTDRNDS